MTLFKKIILRPLILAVRVADEKGCMIGSTIGYAVRFDSKQDEENTRVKFVTDGVLLQEMTSDPLLRRSVLKFWNLDFLIDIVIVSLREKQ